MGALGALALSGSGCADAERERGSTPRAAFAGGGAGGAEAVERRVRADAARMRVRAGGSAVVTVRPGHAVRLRERPGGRVLIALGDRTPFGSPSVLTVVRREGGWLGVLSDALQNGRIGWIRDDRHALAHARRRVRVVVDRSERRMVLLRDGREVLSAAVGVGRLGSETPLGRFAVTDKLDGGRYASSYGCCILALTGRQPNLPPGWTGGDRLAIHGTNGATAARVRSAGCVTMDEAPLRRLMESVPLGTLVTIRA